MKEKMSQLLEDIKKDLIFLAHQVEDAIFKALKALEKQDKKLAKEVFDLNKKIDVHEVKIEDFDRVIAINLRGAYLCAKETIKHLLSRGKAGVIINLSSVHEIIPKPKYLSYSISKGGMGNLTRRHMPTMPGAAEQRRNPCHHPSSGASHEGRCHQI